MRVGRDGTVSGRDVGSRHGRKWADSPVDTAHSLTPGGRRPPETSVLPRATYLHGLPVRSQSTVSVRSRDGKEWVLHLSSRGTHT